MGLLSGAAEWNVEHRKTPVNASSKLLDKKEEVSASFRMMWVDECIPQSIPRPRVVSRKDEMNDEDRSRHSIGHGLYFNTYMWRLILW
jgi:hypothetical protein